MKVRAKIKGFYGTLRQPGEVFNIAKDKAFSKRWMEKVHAKEPVTRPHLDDDGALIKKPRRTEPINNIKDVKLDEDQDISDVAAQEEARARSGEPGDEEPKVSRRRRAGPTAH